MKKGRGCGDGRGKKEEEEREGGKMRKEEGMNDEWKKKVANSIPLTTSLCGFVPGMNEVCL